MDFYERVLAPDEQALAELESAVGAPLPADYRAWLLAEGGGQLEEEMRYGTDDLDADDRTHPSVTIFLGLGAPEQIDLAWYRRTYASRMPAELIPVATNDVGDLVVLAVSGEHTGSTWHWAHEEETADEPQPYWGNLTRVTDSFTTFVEGLVPVPW